MTAWRHARPGHRQDQAEGDEGEVHDDDAVERLRQLGRGQVAGVELLEIRHARIGAQLLVQLGRADIHAGHAHDAALQEAIREPTRGGADVEAVPAGDIDLEIRQRRIDLFTTA